MNSKYTRLSTTAPRYGMASMPGMRSTNPTVQAMIEAAQKKREEEERAARMAEIAAQAKAAETASSFAQRTSNPGTAAAMAALPAAPDVTPASARIRSTNPLVQEALDAKYAREDAAYREWEKQREARNSAHLADLKSAGGVYASLPSRADFGAFSQAREDVEEPTYRYINDPEGYGREYDLAADGRSDLIGLRILDDNERRTYTYLYNKNGRAFAKRYLDELMATKSDALAKQSKEYHEKFAEEAPVVSSALSPLVSVMGGATSAADLAVQNVRRAVTGKGVDYNSQAQQIGRTAEDVRGTVSEKIDSPVGRFLYDVGMSGADSLAAGAFGSLGGAALLGAGAGASAARDAAARGASDNQALIQGLAAAAAETIFEKISIGELRALKEVPVTGARSVAKNLIKSLATNATEEAATELANVVVDTINMGGLSNYRTSVDAYMAQGMREEDAKAKAIADAAGQVGLAALAGGVMGVAFGGIGSAASGIKNEMVGARINRLGVAQDALDEGKAQVRGTEARRLADRLAEKQNAGKRLGNMEIGALARETEQQIRADKDVLGNDLPTFAEQSAATKATAAAMKRAGNALGREVRFFRDAPEVGGYSENGVVWMNIDAAEPMAAVFARLAGRNKNAALRLYDRVREWAASARGDEETAFLAKAQRLYAQALRETKGQASGERSFSFVGVNKDGVRIYETDFNESQTPEQRKKLFKDRIASIFNLGAVELRTDIKKITVNGDKFTMNKNLFGDDNARPEEMEAKINALYDLADILSESTFSKAEPEESYINHEKDPKNNAHKNVKYWYKFDNDIILDGVPYHVSFNIRDKGRDGQYQYLIEFKEKRAYDISHTTASSLRRTPRTLFDKSIPQTDTNSNPSLQDVTELSQSGRQWSIADEEAAEESNVTVETTAESNEIVLSTNTEHITYDGDTIRIMDKPSKEELGQLYRYVARRGGDVNLIMGERAEVDGETVEQVTEEYSAMGPAATADDILCRVRGHYGVRGKVDGVDAADPAETPEPQGESRVGMDEDYWRAVGEAADAAAPAEEGGSVMPGYLAELLRREEETFAHERERLIGEQNELRQRGSEKTAFAGEPVSGGLGRTDLTVKAEEIFDRDIRRAANAMSRSVGLSWMADKTEFQAAAQRLAEQYLASGEYAGTAEERTQKTRDAFEALWYLAEKNNAAAIDAYKGLFDGLTLRFGSGEAERTYREKLVPKYGDRMQFGDGGVSIGEAYEKLRERAPTLFPEYCKTEEAQLKRMENVSASLDYAMRRQERLKNPSAYADEVKRAKIDFYAAIKDELQAAELVRRHAADSKSAEEAVEETPTDPADLVEIAHKANKVRKELEKIRGRYLLTSEDNKIIDRLMRGEMKANEVRSINREAIMAVYQKKLELERVREPVDRYNARRRAQIDQQVDDSLGTLDNIKDKKMGISYNVNTMERNIYDAFLDRPVAERIIATYIAPVHRATAEMTRARNAFVKRVKAMKISQDVAKGNRASEAYAVQFIGEANDNILQLEQKLKEYKSQDVIDARAEEEMLNGRTLEQWKDAVDQFKAENPSMDWAKIDSAVATFRQIYDELFEQMNLVRVRNGYDPVDYRRGYFPHFRDNTPDGVFGKIMAGLGVTVDVTPLPTSINGMTETFRPGINYMGATKQRKGYETDYDAIEGFDRYLNGALRMIYHTDNIQRLRALERRIRYATTDEGMREMIDKKWRELEADETKSDEDKLEAMQKLYAEGRFTLSNFCLELTEYTNILAGKRSKHDRSVESLFGRNVYNFFNAINRRVGANMVAANIGSAMTNFIPMQQGYAQLGGARIMRGMWGTLNAMRRGDDFAMRSDFLTNRRGNEMLGGKLLDKISEKTGIVMQAVDNLTAETLVRARYEQNTARGLSAEESMAEADRWAASVMGDRSLGAMPTIFHATNPLFKFFTQFQLEVANNAAYLTKDLPREAQGTGELVKWLAKYFISGLIFNELYEVIFGRRPALDPISWANEMAGDITGYELPNLFELGADAVSGNLDAEDFRSEKTSIAKAAQRLLVNVIEQTPFVSGILPVFVEDADLRLPITSAIPNIPNVVNAFDEGRAWQDRTEMLYKELSKPLYYIGMPLGGGQLKKAIEGVAAVIRGGSYSYNSQGERTLQYAIPSDNAAEFAGNFLRAAVFGKSSFGTAQDWVDSEFDSFSVKETAVYRGLVDIGMSKSRALAAMNAIRGAEKTENESADRHKRRTLREMDMTDAEKAVIYTGLLATDAEIELLRVFSEENLRVDRAAVLLNDLRDAAGTSDKRRMLAEADGMGDLERLIIYREKISKAWDEEIAAAHSAGVSFSDFLMAQNALAEIEANEEKNETETENPENRYADAVSVFNGSMTANTNTQTAWEIKQEKRDEEARKTARDNAFIEWAIGRGYSMEQRFVLMDCLGVSTQAKKENKKKQFGLSLPTLPQIKLPQIKLPEMPQISLPNFGG